MSQALKEAPWPNFFIVGSTFPKPFVELRLEFPNGTELRIFVELSLKWRYLQIIQVIWPWLSNLVTKKPYSITWKKLAMSRQSYDLCGDLWLPWWKLSHLGLRNLAHFRAMMQPVQKKNRLILYLQIDPKRWQISNSDGMMQPVQP